MPRYYRLGVVTVYEFLGERFLLPLRTGFAARLAERRLRSDKRKALEDARRYAHRGARDKAVSAYQALIHADPADARLRLELGDILRRWGRVDEAITQYTRLADQYRREGFEARAVALLKQILKLDSKRYSAYVSLSELYEEMGLDGEAMHSLQVAIDGLHGEGRTRDALELLRRVSRLDPENTESRIKVADLLQQEGMVKDAIAEFEAVIDELQRVGAEDLVATVYGRMLAIQPDNVEMLVKRSQMLLARGEAREAEVLAIHALEVAPEEPTVLEALMAIYENKGAADELASTARSLARLYRDRGDLDRARDLSQRWPPEDIEAATDPEEDDLPPEFITPLPDGEAMAADIGGLGSLEPVGEEVDTGISSLEVEDECAQGDVEGVKETRVTPEADWPLAADQSDRGFATGHEFIPDPADFASGPPLLDVAESQGDSMIGDTIGLEIEVDGTPELAAQQAFDESVSDSADVLISGGIEGPLSDLGEDLDGIFADFKRGVNETLTGQDVQTRYDLGIAYREMGLLEDAMGEFTICQEFPETRLDSLYMLALCSFDSEKVSEAVRYLKEALLVPEVDVSRRDGLFEELGRAYETLGDEERAGEAYAGMSRPRSSRAEGGESSPSSIDPVGLSQLSEADVLPDGQPTRVNRVSFV